MTLRFPLRPWGLALAAAVSPALAAAPAELAEIKAQIEQLKAAYEQRIAALEGRLAQAEARAGSADVAARSAQSDAKTAQATGAAAPSGSRAGLATAFNPEVSLILQGQYKQMKNLPERGITGFWPAAGHTHDGGDADKRGFSLGHTELVLAANVDPYWRGQAILALVDSEVEVEEAWFQATGLGDGMGLKGGRFRSGIGYLNEQHPHQWDFADAPLAYAALFGKEGSYTQDGLQFKWVAPTETFLELGAEVGRGQKFPGSERNKNGSGAGAVFAHVGGDVGVAQSWRAGVAYLRTSTRGREAEIRDVGGLEGQGMFSGQAATWLADFVWKWAPNGNPKYENFKFQGEYFQRREKGSLACADENASGNACNGLADSYRRRQSGGYVQGVYQLTPQWRAGYRYDRLASGSPHIGTSLAPRLDFASAVLDRYHPTRHSLMGDYSWSEYSRLRLQFAWDKSMPGVTDRQITLQYIVSLGAHGAHKF